MQDTIIESAGARPESERSFMRSVLDALRGGHHDYTEGAIGRSLLLLAIPMVLEMVLESVFAVVDIFFVARLGADAVAVVSLTESVITLVYAVAMGLGIGATAVVARRVGERDPEAAGRAAAQTLLLGVAVSAAIGAVGVAFGPRVLSLMGGSDAVVAAGAGFTRVMFGGCGTIVLLFLVNAIFRGAGDAAIAMRVLWLANGLNIVLAPCFIFGVGPFPELGVTGAAVGTTIGRGAGVAYALSHLLREGGRLRVTRAMLVPDAGLMRRIVRLSGSGMFQVFIGMASWIGLVRIISGFGSDALAGYQIGIRVVMFALLPSVGLSNAAATMVGQALGAGKPARAERAVWMACGYNVAFLGLVGLLLAIFAPEIVALFAHGGAVGPEVVRYGVDSLRVVSYGFAFYGAGMVLETAFNGAGDTWTPTLMNLGVFWLWEIPLAYALAVPLGFGPHGVFLAILIAFSTLAVVSAVAFRRGTWKAKVV